jgi:3-methyl-2-oxobutanoate hydroxymethyltransferase
VKLEGGSIRVPMIEALISAQIPVMGHLGLTPQSVHAMGGYRVQGRGEEAGHRLNADASALADAGCFAVVLEGIPAPLGAAISKDQEIPMIGIGAGAGCDGQVLVFHDLLGLNTGKAPKFVRRYADLAGEATAAIAAYAADVRAGVFPGEGEVYS